MVAPTMAMICTSPWFCSMKAVTIFTICARNATTFVTTGRMAVPTDTNASCIVPLRRFIWLAKLPEVRMASPCAAVVPRMMIARRAITFCCSVALLGSNPWFKSSCLTAVSLTITPYFFMTSEDPVSAACRSRRASSSAMLLKLARSIDSCVICLLISLRRRGVKTQWHKQVLRTGQERGNLLFAAGRPNLQNRRTIF